MGRKRPRKKPSKKDYGYIKEKRDCEKKSVNKILL